MDDMAAEKDALITSDDVNVPDFIVFCSALLLQQHKLSLSCSNWIIE